jgi:light-regulated signal transduction histidine kinase (bacteriophytochrome)
VDDLLSFSRMGRIDLLRNVVDLNELVADARREVEADVPHLRIEWAITPLPAVIGDRAMLRLVLVNLLSNAVKYSASRDIVEVEIGAQARPGEHVIYVRDNGVGFDMTYVDKLFGVFQRLHSSDDFEGTGIGLANVRRIIQRHGGQTWAEGSVGHGATFYFSLPNDERARTA